MDSAMDCRSKSTRNHKQEKRGRKGLGEGREVDGQNSALFQLIGMDHLNANQEQAPASSSTLKKWEGFRYGGDLRSGGCRRQCDSDDSDIIGNFILEPKL